MLVLLDALIIGVELIVRNSHKQLRQNREKVTKIGGLRDSALPQDGLLTGLGAATERR